MLSARQVTALNGGHDKGQGEAEAPVRASLQERLEAQRLALTLAQWTPLESVDQALQAAAKVLRRLKRGEVGYALPHTPCPGV